MSNKILFLGLALTTFVATSIVHLDPSQAVPPSASANVGASTSVGASGANSAAANANSAANGKGTLSSSSSSGAVVAPSSSGISVLVPTSAAASVTPPVANNLKGSISGGSSAQTKVITPGDSTAQAGSGSKAAGPGNLNVTADITSTANPNPNQISTSTVSDIGAKTTAASGAVSGDSTSVSLSAQTFNPATVGRGTTNVNVVGSTLPATGKTDSVSSSSYTPTQIFNTNKTTGSFSGGN